jgi:hypothetical protein
MENKLDRGGLVPEQRIYIKYLSVVMYALQTPK